MTTESSPSTEQSPQYKILLVDDDPVQLELLTHVFEESTLGLTVFCTRVPKVALDIAKTEVPDVIVTDWHMPEMSGLELIQALKQSELTQDIPILMCSGVHLSDMDLFTSLKTGAVDYVRKPVNTVEILARVSTMLRVSTQHKLIKQKNAELEEEVRRHRITLDKLTMSEQYLKLALEKNQRLARIDVLTELPNRRACVEVYKKMSSLARRKQSKMAVALADLDFFKSINDLHGHDCGDYVLQESAKIFRQTIRESDFVGRWGGEEFIFYFMDVNVDGLKIILNKVRKALADSPLFFANSHLRVTASFGGSLIEGDFEAIVKTADEALYLCKENGRNTVEIAAADPKKLNEPC